MGTYQSGTALLTVECDGDDAATSTCSLYASINCLSGIDKSDYRGQVWLSDSVQELAAHAQWLPRQCYKMKHGDKLVFKVSFSQSYTRGDRYSTEDDEDMTFTSIRKLRHRRGADETRKDAKRYYRPKRNLVYGGIWKREPRIDNNNDDDEGVW